MILGRKGDVFRLSASVAMDDDWSDYDIWRALKTVDNELYRLERQRLPLPIAMIYLRGILSAARRERGAAS